MKCPNCNQELDWIQFRVDIVDKDNGEDGQLLIDDEVSARKAYCALVVAGFEVELTGLPYDCEPVVLATTRGG